jgi:hypothetical protein
MSHRRTIRNDDVESQKLVPSHDEAVCTKEVLFPSYVDFRVREDSEDRSITRFAPSPPRFTYRQRVGKMYAISRHRVFGPCWIMTLVTASLIVIVPFSLFYSMKGEIQTSTILYMSLWTLATLFMLFLTSCTNPGIYPIVRNVPEDTQERWAYCKSTDSFRPVGVIFDQECGVLIRDVDHFCPWVGTTVAKGNIYRFFGFVGMLVLTICWMIFAAVNAGFTSKHIRYH